MRHLALAAAVVLGTVGSASAQSVVATTVRALLELAIDEQRVFHNCIITERTTYETVKRNWQKDVADALPLLAEAGLSAEEIADFETRAQSDALIMRKRAFGDIINFCAEADGWMEKMYRLDYVLLPLMINRLLHDS